MSLEKITLLTGNAEKLKHARTAFHDYGIDVDGYDFPQPEIQAPTSMEVARFTAVAAANVLRKPVIREDHSFYIDELGMPGPFMAYIDKTITSEQLVKIVDTLPNRNAHFEIAAAYADPDGSVFETSYQVPVQIATSARGEERPGIRWERAMTLMGDERTFAEFPSAERDHLWTGNYHSIAMYIRDAWRQRQAS